MSTEHDCELCAADGDKVVANRYLNGAWMCVECIVAMNEAEDRERNAKKDGLATRPGPVVIPRQIIDPASLVSTLSFVMDGLLGGTVEADLAQVACKVSGEMIKAMDLGMRMKKTIDASRRED